MTWSRILNEWPVVEADLHEIYGLDIAEILHCRSWRWLRIRILGLLSTESRLARLINPPKNT